MHCCELRQSPMPKGKRGQVLLTVVNAEDGRTPPSGTNRGQPRLRRRLLPVLIAVLLSASVNNSNTKEEKKKKKTIG